MIYVALATKLENYKKKENCLSTHIYICCQKKELMIYVTLAKNYKKNIHDIYSCYPCMFRCCTNGRGSVPSVISKEHPLTGAAYN